MKRFVLASLLALPVLGLTAGQSAAFFSISGKKCSDFSFHFPRIMFGIDTGHHQNAGGGNFGYNNGPCGNGGPNYGPPAPWYQQFPGDSNGGWRHLTQNQNGTPNGSPVQMLSPSPAATPVPAPLAPPAAATTLQPATYRTPAATQAVRPAPATSYQYTNTSVPAPGYWYE